MAGRLTFTNVLHFDAAIADIISRDHAYDMVSIDFMKAFDKAPHHRVLNALSLLGICLDVVCKLPGPANATNPAWKQHVIYTVTATSLRASFKGLCLGLYCSRFLIIL
jgi:hypothetical protein